MASWLTSEFLLIVSEWPLMVSKNRLSSTTDGLLVDL